MNIIHDEFKELRNYVNSQFQDRVERTYKLMHENQSLEFVLQQKDKYNQLAIAELDINQVFELLETIIDESDPDNDLPQIIHAYQSAESIYQFALDSENNLHDNLSIRELFSLATWNSLPNKWQDLYSQHTLKSWYSQINDWSWLPLVAFIHDLGKIMLLPKFGGLPQWAVVGDTYPVGAPFANSNVFYQNKFYQSSSDFTLYQQQDEQQFGAYQRHCGFDSAHMTWGHDEYLYQVMLKGSQICSEGLYLLRYHSFYPWHTPQTGVIAYQELANDYDWHMLPLLKAFQKADLYSKSPVLPPLAELKIKYQILLDKFITNKLISW
ncbi:MAG: inositol oxygenase [Pseudomonadota bacterium]|jgi:inositol oxygenase